MAEVPGYAIQVALARAGLTMDNVDVFEINEAFAAMPLVSTKIMANGNKNTWTKIMDKTNRMLGKQLLQSVIFSDFSFIEQ